MKIVIMNIYIKPKNIILFVCLGPYLPGCLDVMTEYSRDGCFFRLYYPSAISKQEALQVSHNFHFLLLQFNSLNYPFFALI